MTDSAPPRSFRFGDFHLDRRRRVLSGPRGQPIHVTAKAFETLAYFLEHPGVIIERSTLLDALWPDTVVEENNLSQTIAALRRVLGDGYIVTVRRRGYQFVADVRADAGDGPPAAGIDETLPPRRRFAAATLAYSAAGGLAVVAALILVYRLSAPAGSFGDRAPAAKVAVLPCDNLSADPDDAYLALGMHQEILDQLGTVRDLLVVSRSSMMQYASERPPIPQIAEALEASAVIECTVRRSGTQIVVTAQLIDPETDGQLWSQAYPGDSDLDVRMAMQTDIARRVADSLGAGFLPADRRRLEQPPTTTPEAYALFLKARQATTEGGYSLGYSQDAFLDYIGRAIDADPGFALAYAYRGYAYLSRALDALRADYATSGSGPARDSVEGNIERARRDSAHALELDPGIGRAHAVAGAIGRLYGDAQAAQAHFDRAIELSRNDAQILSFITGFYLRDGRRAAALRLLEKIRRLNPIDHDVGYFFYLAGDRRTAKEILRGVIGRNPAHLDAHINTAWLEAIDGDADAAERELRLVEELVRDEGNPEPEYTPSWFSMLAYTYGRIGLDDDVQRAAAQFERVARGSAVPTMRSVELHLATGDVDGAYEYASTIGEKPLFPFVSLELEFVLNAYNDPVFETPRFAALRRRIAARDWLLADR